MATSKAAITILKSAPPLSEETARRKAEFDSSMVMIRHRVKFATREDAEYFFRELMREAGLLSRRHGLKVG